MPAKLVIVNNGLKDLRGHYFETAVSIAEAAREAGLRPVLAAHVRCPADLMPGWLEFHPAFTTDHWMSGGEEPNPPAPFPKKEGGVQDSQAPGRLRSSPERTSLEHPPPFLGVGGRGGEVLRPLLPPAALALYRGLRRARRSLVPLAKFAVRQFTPPLLLDRLRSLRRRPAAAGPLAPVLPVPEPPAPPDSLALRLARVGAPQEYPFTLRFEADLERLLRETEAGPGDHVFLPTAHGRELVAVQRLIAKMGEAAAPTFHLEFRHPPGMPGPDDPPGFVHPYCLQHRAFFDELAAGPACDRVRLYTDTEELAEEFADFSGLDFAALPIPFRARLLARKPRGDGSLTVAYFGDARAEKGFHRLPDLVDALRGDYLRPGRVCFLIQASLANPDADSRCRTALHRLMVNRPEHVRLVGLDGPLSPEDYYTLVSGADLLLCPYHAGTYRSRSSGTLAEGIAAGIPTVVPADTWLARRQPLGSGETFAEGDSLVEAVRRVIDRYPAYRAKAEAHREAWLAEHAPSRLVRALLGEREGTRRAA